MTTQELTVALSRTLEFINSLTANTDIHSNHIGLGTVVRSFDIPMILTRDEYVKPNGRCKIIGMDTDTTAPHARVQYVEGAIEAIGPVAGFPDCDRYTIRVTKQVIFADGKEYEPHLLGELVYPPVNGTPSMLGERTFGVVAVEDN